MTTQMYSLLIILILWNASGVGALQQLPLYLSLVGVQAIALSSASQATLVEITYNEVNTTEVTDSKVNVSPDELPNLVWKSDPSQVLLNVSLSQAVAIVVGVEVIIEDESKAEIIDGTTVWKSNQTYAQGHRNVTAYTEVSFKIRPLYLGRTELKVNIFYHYLDNDTTQSSTALIDIAVIREETWLDLAFENIVFAMLIIVTLSMGAELDIKVVKEVLKEAKVPVVSTICQSLCMPLLAYSIVWLQGYTGGTALGLFMLGIAPGGGPSNMYTHLLDGSISVSVTMTLVSTLLSVALIPFWIYTLGSTLPGYNETTGIPFTVIAQTLAVVTIPLALGLLIQYKLPKVTHWLRKSLKVMMMIVLLFIFTVGIYSSRYVFDMFQIDVMMTAALLPYGGFLLGGLVSFACRFQWKIVKTISIETGLQNSAIPFIVMHKSFSSPEAELAITPVVWGIILTPIPLLIATSIYLTYSNCKTKETIDVHDVESLTHSSTSNVANDTQSHHSALDKCEMNASPEKETFLLS